MAEISIGVNHQAQLTRQQHVLEWLQMERARLEVELQHVLTAGQRVQNELMTFLQQSYGVDITQPVTLDTERGVIVVPDAPGGADDATAVDLPDSIPASAANADTAGEAPIPMDAARMAHKRRQTDH